MTITDEQAARNDRLFRRQLGLFNPSEYPGASATFIGVGGIGSFAAFGAAKLGIPNIRLIDPDVVEEHNAPNQFSPISRVGEAKVDALAAEIQAHVGDTVAVDAAQDDAAGQLITGPTISGLDSMTARKDVWEGAIKNNPSIPVYMDARLATQIILIYTVCPYNPEDIERYEATLHSDDEAEEASCTARGLIDVGLMVGSVLTRALRLHISGAGMLDPITYINHETLSVTKGGWVGG